MIIPQKSYDVSIAGDPHTYFPDWLQQRNYDAYFVICDEQTEALCYPALAPLLPDHTVIAIPAGEQFKNIHTCVAIWEELSNNLATRKSLVINCGGGVIGDMGGFAAATFKRGCDFIQMPTTLLSQVDASVGGKLGIDLQEMKNLVGVFKDPSAVFICTDFLSTLPQRQLYSGFAEILKHGLIYDAEYWNMVSGLDFQQDQNWKDLIARSVQIKSAVVEADPYEAGLRKILNFGHTIGHAVETCSLRQDIEPLLHGEAIAIGMICEAFLSVKHCGLPSEAVHMIANTCMRYFEHYDLTTLQFEELVAVMQQDKKNEQQQLRLSLLKQIGTCVYDIPVSESDIQEALQFYKGL